MRVTVSVSIDAGDDSPTVVHDVFSFERGPLAPGTLGLHLDEANGLLAAVQEKVVSSQVNAALAERRTCPDCGKPHRDKDAREIVMRSAFGTLGLSRGRSFGSHKAPSGCGGRWAALRPTARHSAGATVVLHP